MHSSPVELSQPRLLLLIIIIITLIIINIVVIIRLVYKSHHSVEIYVANTNARGQLMLILGTMHNLEVYAIVIQKNDGAIFKNQL